MTFLFAESDCSGRYLTRGELAELIGCQPRSLGCMRRWLERNGWPHVVNIAGVPMVSRDYYDVRMNGVTPFQECSPDKQLEPDFSALES